MKINRSLLNDLGELRICPGRPTTDALRLTQSIYEVSNFDTNVPVKLKLQHPPRAYPGNLTLCCARGVGNLTVKVFAGVGNLKTAWEGWGI